MTAATGTAGGVQLVAATVVRAGRDYAKRLCCRARADCGQSFAITISVPLPRGAVRVLQKRSAKHGTVDAQEQSITADSVDAGASAGADSSQRRVNCTSIRSRERQCA